MHDWAQEFAGAVTICDADYTIVYMNDRALATFAADGGASLIGTDLRKCHQARSNEIMARILATGEPNSYTIEKRGVHKLIYQAPWFRDGKIAGLVELSLVIPADLPHFVRS